jgi:hypothetical protein
MNEKCVRIKTAIIMGFLIFFGENRKEKNFLFKFISVSQFFKEIQ